MTVTAQLLQQRSLGQVKLHMGRDGPVVLREAGAAKIRLPRNSREAILINVGGGLAGGDAFEFEFSCNAYSNLTITSQAAERVYRSLGPEATISAKFNLENAAQLFWLPQETILYDAAALQRNFEVTMAASSRFLAIEPIVFGRTEMNETIKSIHVKDRWRIFRKGRLVHAEELSIGPSLPNSKATLSGAFATANLIYVAGDAELRLAAMREIMPENSAASAWNGKLIARFIAKDSYILRKALIPAIKALAGEEILPKIWTA
jgi:urease accessory protein